jgi:iron-sulfur cluster repair protein YtfE (RIC family)
MDAIKLLKQDHDVVGQLLADLAATTKRGTKTRRDLLSKIRQELEIHIRIEEEIFYPAFKAAGTTADDDKMYFEALEEHRAADELVLVDLMNTAPDGDQFGGRAKVLKELVEHHVKEEEKSMFPRAKELIEKAQLQKLGEELEARKQELKAQAKAA